MTIRSYLVVAAMAGTTIGAGSIMLPRWLEGRAAAAEDARKTEQTVSYSGCREVRAAGKAPLQRGEPGYRTWMDGDNDGVACENY